MKQIIFPLWIVIPILSKLVFAFTTKKVCQGSLLTNKKHHHGLQRIRNRIFRFHQEKKVWNSNCFHKIISPEAVHVQSTCAVGPASSHMLYTVASHNPKRLMQLKRQKLGKIQDMYYFQQWLLHCLKDM